MSQKRAVVRDRESGGATDLQLAQRAYHNRRKLRAAQQVEQLENDVSKLTKAAKRAASENDGLSLRIAQLEAELTEARAAPFAVSPVGEEKTTSSDEPSDEAFSGSEGLLKELPESQRWIVAQQRLNAALSDDGTMRLLTRRVHTKMVAEREKAARKLVLQAQAIPIAGKAKRPAEKVSGGAKAPPTKKR